MSSPLLRDKIAVVTGDSQGIGRAIASAFAKEGARVFGISRSQDISSNWKHLKGNVGNASDVSALAAQIEEEFGRVDVLVNNAGTLGHVKSLKDYNVADWDAAFEVNLRGSFLVTQSLLKMMRPGASIINVSSGYALGTRGGIGAYGITKMALEGFSNTLSEDLLPSQIRVNVVDPGAVRTSMRGSLFPSEDPSKLPTPEQVIPVFLYLASERSKHITGHRFLARHFLP